MVQQIPTVTAEHYECLLLGARCANGHDHSRSADNPRYNVIPVICGLIGASFLFYGSMLLIFEARLALSTIHLEMDYIWTQTTKVAPADLVKKHKPHFVHFRRQPK